MRTCSKLVSAWPRWSGRLIAFFVGQLSTQAITVATGLLLLRWMSEAEYAKTGVVFGFQTMFAAFVDLGIGGALVSLIGNRSGSPDVVGSYVAAARWWRRVLMLLMLPTGALAFFLIYGNQGWPVGETLTLFLCIALSLYFSGWTAWASAPLLLQNKLGAMYLASNAGALLRLGGCALLYAIGRLDAVALGLLGVVVGGVTALLYWRAAVPFVKEPPRSDPALRTELRKIVSPLVPNVVFYALQGQVSMLLISLFGTAQGIAEVTALGRLGQILALLTGFYSMIVGPHFAQLPKAAVRVRYGVVCGATVALSAVVSLLAFRYPESLLLLLGSKYEHLVHEVGWLVLGSAITLVNASLWAVHLARKWVYWTATFLNMSSIVAVQAIFIGFANVSTTAGVIYMGVAASVAGLMCQAFQGYLGFRSERQAGITTGHEPAVPTTAVVPRN